MPGSSVLHYLPVCSNSCSLSWWCSLGISKWLGVINMFFLMSMKWLLDCFWSPKDGSWSPEEPTVWLEGWEFSIPIWFLGKGEELEAELIGNDQWCNQSHMLSCFSHVRSFVTTWTVAHQAPLPMGFSRQEYWRGRHALLQGDLPDPGIKPTSLMSPALASKFFPTSATWEWWHYVMPM